MFQLLISLIGASVFFHTMVTANRAGKEALKQLLGKLPVSQAD
jgi:hypothetical protein